MRDGCSVCWPFTLPKSIDLRRSVREARLSLDCAQAKPALDLGG